MDQSEGKRYIDTLIIGGGICGSYLALQLLEENQTNFLILEAAGPYRGKQKSLKVYPYSTHTTHTTHTTLSEDPQILETGSSVFLSSQDHLLGLLHYLDLEDQIVPLDSTMKAFYTFPGLSSKEAKTRFLKLKEKVFQEATRFPVRNETLDELSNRILTSDEYSLLIGCWPEWFEMCDQNAYCASISEHFSGHWCRLEYGLEQILDRAVERLDGYYQWYQPVSKIEQATPSFVVHTKGGIVYECKNLYLACNLRSLQEDIDFVGCKQVEEYSQLGTYKPCMRVYVVLKRDIVTRIQSFSGPPREGGWLCKYSLQVSPRVWLISYPDGELVQEMYEKLLSGQLIDDWIHDMNLYFSLRLTRDDIQEIPEVTVWGDAYSILNKQWFETRSTPYITDNVVVTALPKPFDQAWMEGHLYQLPRSYHIYREGFVEEIFHWIDSRGVKLHPGPFQSCAILPCIRPKGYNMSALFIQERGRVKYDRSANLNLNPIGGKISDKYFPDIRGALYASFDELAEEGHILIDHKRLAQAILCVGSVTINKDTNQSCLCIGILFDETEQRMIEFIKTEQKYRSEFDFLPSRWMEIEEPVVIQSGTSLSFYPQSMMNFVQKYVSSIDTTTGLTLKDCKSIRFNHLALPFVSD